MILANRVVALLVLSTLLNGCVTSSRVGSHGRRYGSRGYHHHHHGYRHGRATPVDAVFAAAVLIGGIAAVAQASEEPAPPQESPQDRDARQRELRARLRQIRWADMPAEQKRVLEKSCSELHASVTRRAVAAEGKPRAECPATDRFIATCRELGPEVVRCLQPEVLAKERERCQEQFRQEDVEAAVAMNETLRRCSPRASNVSP